MILFSSMIVCVERNLFWVFFAKMFILYIFTKFFLPQFCFSSSHSDRHAPHSPWGPTAPYPLGLPRDTGSPGSSPVKVSSGPRNQWLSNFTNWMSSPPSRHRAQNIPEASSRGASPEPLQEDLPCPRTPSDLESMLTCYVWEGDCLPSGHWESLLFAFSKLQILLRWGVREMGEWNGNKVHLRAFLAGAAELSPVLPFLLMFLEVTVKSEAHLVSEQLLSLTHSVYKANSQGHPSNHSGATLATYFSLPWLTATHF